MQHLASRLFGVAVTLRCGVPAIAHIEDLARIIQCMETGRQRSHVYIEGSQAASAAAPEAQASCSILAPIVPFIASLRVGC
jgi:hypothetical protein